MKKLIFGMLVAFSVVSVSFGFELREVTKGEVEGVKKIVEELEFYEEKTGLNYTGRRALKEGRLFLEFVEKVKQSPEKECLYAVRDVIGSDDNNKERYQYYLWSDTSGSNFYCLDVSGIADKYKQFKKDMEYNKELYDAFIRQKANVMGSGNGAGLKDGVNEVGTLSDGTKIEIVKEKK